MKSNRLLVAFTCLLVSGCFDHNDYPLPSNTAALTTDPDLMAQVARLSDVEKTLFRGYALRAQMTGSLEPDAYESTLGQAIAAQQLWLNELATEVQNQTAQPEDAMSAPLQPFSALLATSLVSVNLISRDDKKGIEADYFKMVLEVKNNSPECLQHFKGTVILKDPSGGLLRAINLSNVAALAAGTSTLYAIDFSHNQFRQEDLALAQLDLSAIQFEWIPLTYTFKD